MENRYRVLGIAPYEGMKKLMSDLVEDYPEIDLTLFVGDLEEGLEIAHSNFHGSYDVVISRGGTAKMLRRNLPRKEARGSCGQARCGGAEQSELGYGSEGYH